MVLKHQVATSCIWVLHLPVFTSREFRSLSKACQVCVAWYVLDGLEGTFDHSRDRTADLGGYFFPLQFYKFPHSPTHPMAPLNWETPHSIRECAIFGGGWGGVNWNWSSLFVYMKMRLPIMCDRFPVGRGSKNWIYFTQNQNSCIQFLLIERPRIAHNVLNEKIRC